MLKTLNLVFFVLLGLTLETLAAPPSAERCLARLQHREILVSLDSLRSQSRDFEEALVGLFDAVGFTDLQSRAPSEPSSQRSSHPSSHASHGSSHEAPQTLLSSPKELSPQGLSPRQLLIREIIAIDSDFMDLLFQRIINDYLIHASPKLESPPSALLDFLQTRVQEFAQSHGTAQIHGDKSQAAMDILITAIGILRRGHGFTSKNKQMSFELRGPRLPQTLSKWGYPFVHKNPLVAERGNALILHVLSNIKPEQREELGEVFHQLDHKHIQYFLSEIFHLNTDLDKTSLAAVKKYPDLFIESLLWDPFYNPYLLKLEKRRANQLARRQQKHKLFEDEHTMGGLWESLFYYVSARSPSITEPVPPSILLHTKSLERLWVATLKDYKYEVVHSIMEKMRTWPLFYRKELLKRFFEDSEIGTPPQVKADLTGFFEWLEIPDEVILLNDRERFAKLNKKEQTDLYLKILKLPPQWLDGTRHPSLWHNPINHAIQSMVEISESDRRIEKNLIELENSDDFEIRINTQLGLLRRGYDPLEFSTLLRGYEMDPRWILPRLIRANFFYPLQKYLSNPQFRQLVERIRSSARYEGASHELLLMMQSPDNQFGISPRWTTLFIEDFKIEGPELQDLKKGPIKQ